MDYIQFLMDFSNIIFIFKNWGGLVNYYKINILPYIKDEQNKFLIYGLYSIFDKFSKYNIYI